jgi:hypothetical protein
VVLHLGLNGELKTPHRKTVKSQSQKPWGLERHRRKWEDNIKMDLRKAE